MPPFGPVISREAASPLAPNLRAEQAEPIYCEMNARVKVKNKLTNDKPRNSLNFSSFTGSWA